MSTEKHLRDLFESITVLSEAAVSRDEEAMLHAVLVMAVSLVEAEAGYLLLLDDDRKRLTYRQAVNEGGESLIGTAFGIRKGGIAYNLLETQQPLNISNLTKHREEYGAIAKQVETIEGAVGMDIDDLLMLPIVEGDTAIGLIEVLNKRGPQEACFDIKDLEVMSAVSKQIGIVIGKFNRIRKLTVYFEEALDQILINEELDTDAVNMLCRIVRERDATHLLQIHKHLGSLLDASPENPKLVQQLLATISKIQRNAMDGGPR